MDIGINLSEEQEAVVTRPFSGSIYLQGTAGSGKTTAAVHRLERMIQEGIPAESIFILVPQRTLAADYYQALQQPDLPPGGQANITTLGGFGQRMVNMFWPVIRQDAGFNGSSATPSFLTLETAQYYLAQVVTPLIEQHGYFEGLRIDRNRLLSQIIDNLNKAAAVGFDHTTFGERLKAAWIGEPAQHHIYDQAQECAVLFRRYCLENNLLDFSLQMEVFTHHLWQMNDFKRFFYGTYRHLIYDNIEEDVPVVHDIVREWIQKFETALLIYDTEGGYRVFLGADTQSGLALSEICSEQLEFHQSWVIPPLMEQTCQAFHDIISRRPNLTISADIRNVLQVNQFRFIPEMAAGVAQVASELIHEQNIPPGQIAVLSPFMSDSLRFTLVNQFDQLQLPVRSHRPSRSLREEPATICLLTLAKLAHPDWHLGPTSQYHVRFALTQSIADMDLVRADLLTQNAFHIRHPEEGLGAFDIIHPDMQERITFTLGERYEILRRWLQEYRQSQPIELDIFLSRLFGEVLSQPGFRFHDDYDAASITARLIESIQKFRWGTLRRNAGNAIELGKEYVRMVEDGVIAAQYLQTWNDAAEDSILLAPAYTFLMSNRPVEVQFWLDAGSIGWWERLNQPLTHPYVLSRGWTGNMIWTDAHEYAYNQESLTRLVSGLIRHCRRKIFIYASGYNEQGDNPRGPLLQAIQGILKRLSNLEGEHV